MNITDKELFRLFSHLEVWTTAQTKEHIVIVLSYCYCKQTNRPYMMNLCDIIINCVLCVSL